MNAQELRIGNYINKSTNQQINNNNDNIQRYHKHTRKRSRQMDDLDATQTHS